MKKDKKIATKPIKKKYKPGIPQFIWGKAQAKKEGWLK